MVATALGLLWLPSQELVKLLRVLAVATQTWIWVEKMDPMGTDTSQTD